MTAKTASASIVLFFFLSCCAEGSVAPETDPDGDSSNNVASDSGTKNNTPGPDANDNCNVCCPGERRCASETQIELCRDNGNGFDATDCGDGEVCSEGICGEPKICEAGSKACQDATTLLTCRATEAGYTSENCPAGTACTGGMCATGLGDGSVCSANADCASTVCHCGTEEACPGVATGYCATKGCVAGSCGPSAVCLDTTKAVFGNPNQDYPHCVTRCTGTCAIPDFSCSQLPVDEGETWASGCYFSEVASIGADCANDTRCLGGLCRTDFFTQSNFCTRDCLSDGVCPPDAACAELAAGVFQCTLLCGDGSVVGQDPCPLDLPVDRFDVTCRNLSLLGGGAKRVCATP